MKLCTHTKKKIKAAPDIHGFNHNYSQYHKLKRGKGSEQRELYVETQETRESDQLSV